MLDVERIKADFPILSRSIHGQRLVYLDNAATTQKPRRVIDALVRYYETSNANIHRGVHTLGEEATEAYERTRAAAARFINAARPDEIVFTRGTTEAINLVAAGWGRFNLNAGDVILVSEMEHHSNLVPWQMLAAATGAHLLAIPLQPDGTLDMASARMLLRGGHVRLLALTHVSNVLGTINPVAELVQLAHAAGALALIDGAQSVPHMPVDVQALDADFLAFSAHKMLGPTGVGVLYGRHAILDAMEPYQGGGSMIGRVTLDRSTWAEPPARFEAGTPNIADVIAFGAAIDYLNDLGMDAVRDHERRLTVYGLERLAACPGVHIYGPLDADHRGGVLTFALGDLHPHDISQMLDARGIEVRAGHHCAQPLHARLNVQAGATTRASLYIYNDEADIDALAEGLRETAAYFDVRESQAVS